MGKRHILVAATVAVAVLKVDWATFSAAAGQSRLPNALLGFPAGKFVYASKWSVFFPVLWVLKRFAVMLDSCFWPFACSHS
ncbi:MAG: hypothetical protein ACOYIR_06235 [Christensenellales bacterium]